jgi:heptosyltransferase I
VTPAQISRLLIVRLGSMGDVIHTLPAVTALREAFPEAVLGWVIEERWAELLCTLSFPRSGPRSPQRPLVDKIHALNTFRWRSSPVSTQTWEQVASALSELRAPHYDVAVDFQGAIRSALVAKWSGTPTVYGVAQPRENVASMFYTRQVVAGGAHVVEQNLALAEAVAGHKLRIPQPTLPRDESAERKTEAWLADRRMAECVLLNPGAGWGAKQWPAERYGEVAKHLAKDGLKSLVNFGPGEDHLARVVEQASGGAAHAVSCSLTELIALTRRARLFIGGDTGPMHLAAGLEVPVVAIFGPTNPARNGPFKARSAVLRNPSSTTSHARRGSADEGMLQITVEDVLAAARTLLGSRHD